MTTTVRISPGQLTDSLTLRANSALADCTDVDGDDAGVLIATRWERLSSGEELLWRVLAWLNGGNDLPSYDDLQAGLDIANYDAAVAAIAAGGSLVAAAEAVAR